ncbi:family 43 glycosylhydrolase [Catalinimonas niigatensis]|uniref:family 43 glycosylhydrolase n=1 Tax=Catalinimonas niigatensis TaxID=1397264 RepID=UPI002666A44B|nr:family 43 glycosylhydrolase [Catalinimonas niigatensis]WPP51211.1 family 43 glycosylhydrolase [Catalinimonas niigatensis]
MRVRKIFCACTLLCLYFVLLACNTTETEVSVDYENNRINFKEVLYQNPVFEPVLADPTIVQSGEFFYAYGTEDNWGSQGGYHLIPVIKSKDLVSWELVGDAMQQKPKWKDKGGIWAPDVTEVDGRYYMYYSFSTWGDPNPGIGVAIADSPQGPFVDQGKVFLSKEIGVENSIDPFYIEEDGKKYLFWGSFHGIYAIQLSDDGRKVIGEKKYIASDHLEAVYVYKKDGNYYLFGSAGSCCEGANSTYKVLVGRSSSLLGPYTDKGGNSFTEGDFGELLIKGHEGEQGFAGPGHNAEIVSDDKGAEWFLYHAMKKDEARLDNGTNRRSLMLDKIIWVDGWPSIEGSQPGISETQAPFFQQEDNKE